MHKTSDINVYVMLHQLPCVSGRVARSYLVEESLFFTLCWVALQDNFSGRCGFAVTSVWVKVKIIVNHGSFSFFWRKGAFVASVFHSISLDTSASETD